jgi:hypothetical protein
MHPATLCLSLSATLAIATAQGLRLPPSADATTNADQPTTNYGQSPDLDFGKDFTSTPTFRTWFTRGHVRFDLTPLANLARPRRVVLQWYQDRARTTPAGCLPVTVHRLTAAWTEGTVTWATNPAFDTGVVVRESVGGWDCSGWHTFDVTPLALDWLANRHPNFGLMIRDDGEISAGAARPGKGHSRESGNAAFRPYLEVSWGAAYGSGCGPTATLPTLTLTGAPQINGSFTLSGAGLLANAPAALLVGVSNTTWGSLPLPFSLNLIGFPQCRVLASGELIVPGATDANGARAVPFAVPNDPTLQGQGLYCQSVALLPPQSLAMTNGYALTIY